MQGRNLFPRAAFKSDAHTKLNITNNWLDSQCIEIAPHTQQKSFLEKKI